MKRIRVTIERKDMFHSGYRRRFQSGFRWMTGHGPIPQKADPARHRALMRWDSRFLNPQVMARNTGFDVKIC